MQSSAIANRRDKMIPKYRAWEPETKFMNDQVRVTSNRFGDGEILIEATDGFGWIEVKPEYLMQSTGLKDKNGVEIFEGDIVIRANEAIGYVAYLQQEAGFVVVTKKSDYRLGHRNTGETYDVATAHEVIGNICSKPKLWEQADEN